MSNIKKRSFIQLILKKSKPAMYLRHLLRKAKSTFKRICFFFYVNFPLGDKVFLIGTPNHINIGDSAIVLAEIKMLKKLFKPKRVKEITTSETENFSKTILHAIKERDIIFCPGGGNLGNLWYEAEELRYRLISSFPKNRIIIFPQTVYFTNDEKGKKALKTAKTYYESHKALTIVARDKVSYELLNRYFYNPELIISPDTVLSTGMKDYNVSVRLRKGILLVFRNDKEKKMTDNDRKIITGFLKENKLSYKITDLYAECPVTRQNRMGIVSKKLQSFADAELVITDRLHGMIFSAITGTPCIVFGNNHHKVQENYEWLSFLPYIRFTEKTEDVRYLIPELLEMKTCCYDNTHLKPYFDTLERRIGNHANQRNCTCIQS